MAEKLREMNETNAKQQKIFEAIESKQNELIAIEESLSIKTKRLAMLSIEVTEIEIRHKAAI